MLNFIAIRRSYLKAIFSLQAKTRENILTAVLKNGKSADIKIHTRCIRTCLTPVTLPVPEKNCLKPK